QHAVVALSGGVEPVDRVGADLHCGLEPEGHLGRGDVVVDGLGYADDGDAVVVQVVDHAHGALAADGDDRVETVAGDRRPDLLGPIGLLVRLVTRGPEHRATAGQQTSAPVDG